MAMRDMITVREDSGNEITLFTSHIQEISAAGVPPDRCYIVIVGREEPYVCQESVEQVKQMLQGDMAPELTAPCDIVDDYLGIDVQGTVAVSIGAVSVVCEIFDQNGECCFSGCASPNEVLELVLNKQAAEEEDADVDA